MLGRARALRLAHHSPNIDLTNGLNRRHAQVFMVMECFEHDLKDILQKMDHPFEVAETKCIMQQLLSACAYMHDHWCVLPC